MACRAVKHTQPGGDAWLRMIFGCRAAWKRTREIICLEVRGTAVPLTLSDQTTTVLISSSIHSVTLPLT